MPNAFFMSTFLVVEFTHASAPSPETISAIVPGVRVVPLVSSSPLFVFTVTADEPNRALHLLGMLGLRDDVKEAYMIRGDAFTLGHRDSGGYDTFAPPQ
jgi:hypothetical protein